MKKNTLIFCVEKGYLEKQGVLLIESIKRFSSLDVFAKIICYSPRKAFRPSEKFKRILEENNIVYIDTELNCLHKDYGIANKIYACAHAEKELNAEHILFLDTDQIIVNNICFDENKSENAVSLTPCYYRNIGVLKGEEIPDIWKEIFTHFQIKDYRYSQSVFDKKETIGNWNAGFIYSDVRNFFTEWKNIFFELERSFTFKRLMHYHTDQIALTLAVHRLGVEVNELPGQYNYGLHLSYITSTYKNHMQDIHNVFTIHYGRSFNRFYLYNPLNQFIEHDSVLWIKERIKELHMYSINPFSSIRRNMKYLRLKSAAR